MKIYMRPFFMAVFGVALSLFAIISAPQHVNAAPFNVGSVNAIQDAQPAIAEKARYHRGHGRHYGGHRGYGRRHYGYGRHYGYRRNVYRPAYYGGHRRCGIRYRTFYNGYRYVSRPVRVCRSYY
jgi:hypothetical protein